MPRLIHNRAVIEDTYTHVEGDGELPESDVIVDLERFLANEAELKARSAKLGVYLVGDDDARSLDGKLEGVALISLGFPKFADGRGYSRARILREQLDYDGRLRAAGDVRHDQLFYMLRCGFDEFALVDGKDPQVAMRAFDTFEQVYQPTADGKKAWVHRA